MRALLRLVAWPFFVESKKPLLLFLVSMAAVVLTAFSHIATPWLIGDLIDAATNGSVDRLRTTVIGLFGVAVLASLGGAIRMLSGRRMADLFRAFLLTRLMRRLLGLRLSDLEGKESRTLNSIFIDDVQGIATLADPLALNIFLAVIQLIGALAILMTRFSDFAWLVLLVMPVNAAIGIWQWPLTRERARAQLKSKTRLDGLTFQVLEGVRDVKSLAADRSVQRQLSSFTSADLLARWRAEVVGAVEHGRYASTWLIMSIVYFVGGMAVIRGELTIGSLTAFVWYVGFLETPISRLWQSATAWQRMQAAVERYAGVIDLPPETEGTVPLLPSATPQVEFRGVTFRYPDAAEPALKDIDLRFHAGQRVAVVGASGAGKTTLVSLLSRLFDPEEGAVTIDGTDLREFTLASLRRYVTVISQEPFTFDGTILDNIGFGLEDCSEAEIHRAATIADADGFIRALRDGYQTILGARGTNLSGGQRRRIAIARAIVRRPRVLVLDEVTGSLDSVSDSAIQEAIEQTRNGCTIITISHRLSSTAGADMIVMLDQGRVIGTGTHSELMRECEPYRTLANLQKLKAAVEAAPGSVDMAGQLVEVGDVSEGGAIVRPPH